MDCKNGFTTHNEIESKFYSTEVIMEKCDTCPNLTVEAGEIMTCKLLIKKVRGDE